MHCVHTHAILSSVVIGEYDILTFFFDAIETEFLNSISDGILEFFISVLFSFLNHFQFTFNVAVFCILADPYSIFY